MQIQISNCLIRVFWYLVYDFKSALYLLQSYVYFKLTNYLRVQGAQIKEVPLHVVYLAILI